MGRVIPDHSISLDGYGAGPNVAASHPMGQGGRLHAWTSQEGGRQGPTGEVLEELLDGAGAVVIGRTTSWRKGAGRPDA
jgi:hypothetical protein